jgi:hypothetical protein
MEDKLIENKEALKILETLKENNDLSFMEEVVKDNKVEFEYTEKKYRVRLLNMHEKEILNNLKLKKFMELLKDKSILLEKDLTKLYKERGINIEEINDKISKIEEERKNVSLKLGESIAHKIEGDVLSTYKSKIIEITHELNLLLIQKNDLLSYSLENQLSNYFIKVLTYMSLEKLENDKWIKLFSNLEDFEKLADEKLMEKAIYCTMLLN